MTAIPKKVPCGFCGEQITTYEDTFPKSTPRKYCDGHCRNEAKKRRHLEKIEGSKWHQQY